MSGQEPQELGVHVSELYNQIQQLQAQVRQAQTQADKAQKEAQAAKFQQTTSAQPSFTIKPPKPDIFEGRRDGANVERWLFQVQQYFEFYGTKDTERIRYAALLLRGTAAIWWQTRTDAVQQNHATEIRTWKQFCTAVTDQFRPVNAVNRARDRLANLRQTGAVKGYIELFRNIALEIPDLSEAEKLDRFKRGLRPRTRQEVELRDPRNLDEAERLADRIDSTLFMKSTRTPFISRTEIFRGSNSNEGPTPMEIDAIGNYQQRQEKRITDTERARFLASGSCFNCGEKGHMAKGCLKKKKNVINVLEYENNNSDDSGKEEPQ